VGPCWHGQHPSSYRVVVEKSFSMASVLKIAVIRSWPWWYAKMYAAVRWSDQVRLTMALPVTWISGLGCFLRPTHIRFLPKFLLSARALPSYSRGNSNTTAILGGGKQLSPSSAAFKATFRDVFCPSQVELMLKLCRLKLFI
jgi:hypothetical protein